MLESDSCLKSLRIITFIYLCIHYYVYTKKGILTNIQMTDIFDTNITCKNCQLEMKKTIVEKNGLELRAVKCTNCGDTIIHPADLNALEHFGELRGKTFNVKLRVVGNSHAISIPKEIVDFITDQHRSMQSDMADMVRLCVDDLDKLTLRFGGYNDDEEN